MVLLIDIGNTNVAIGGCEGERLCFTGSCASDLKKTEDEYALTVKGILELNGFAPAQVEGGIISSVVPHLRTVLGRLQYEVQHLQILQIKKDNMQALV